MAMSGGGNAIAAALKNFGKTPAPAPEGEEQ
jgi:hypothetical protein